MDFTALIKSSSSSPVLSTTGFLTSFFGCKNDGFGLATAGFGGGGGGNSSTGSSISSTSSTTGSS